MSKKEAQQMARKAAKYWLSGLDDQSQFYFATGYLFALLNNQPPEGKQEGDEQ